MSNDRLAEIKARAEAATKGPWSAADERELWREEDPSIEPSWCVSHMRPGFEAMSPTEGYLGDVFTTAGFFESTEADARFVAAVREDVPWLVEQVESLTVERDALAAQVARIKALADDWRYKGEFGWGPWQLGEGPDPEGYVMDHCASALRAALAGSEADTNNTQPIDQEDQS